MKQNSLEQNGVKPIVSRFLALSEKTARAVTLAAHKFIRIDGLQRASAFANNAFLAFFPLILLLATTASVMFGRERAGRSVIRYMESYAPLSGGIKLYVFKTVSTIVETRGEAGALALLVLVWAAAQFFTTIVDATNHAWGYSAEKWWRSPLKALGLLGVSILAVFVGIAIPVLVNMARAILPAGIFSHWIHSLWTYFVPWLALFLGLTLFYKMAPAKPPRLAQVWVSALCATALLHAAQNLFVVYLKHFSTLNVIYGAFGGIIALMLWMYVSGVIFIFCACLSAAQAEVFGRYLSAKI